MNKPTHNIVITPDLVRVLDAVVDQAEGGDITMNPERVKKAREFVDKLIACFIQGGRHVEVSIK